PPSPPFPLPPPSPEKEGTQRYPVNRPCRGDGRSGIALPSSVFGYLTRRPMLRPPMLALLLGLVLVGCDTTETPPVDAFPFDPDTTDFSQITSLDYGDYVQPLLAARDVFSRTATDDRGALDDYEWDDVFYGAPGTGE